MKAEFTKLTVCQAGMVLLKSNANPVAFCWAWVREQSGISIKYNGNRDFVVMNKEFIAAGNSTKIHTN